MIEKDPIGQVKLDKLSLRHLDDWLYRQDTGKKSPNSINRDLTALKSVLAFGAERELIVDKTWRKAKRLTAEDPEERKVLEPEQWARLLEHCEDDLAAIVRGMIYTAARPKELREAKARDLDLDNGELTLRGYKGKDGKLRTRKVTLSAAAVAFFRKHLSAVGEAHLFTRSDGSPWPKEWLNRKFRDARSAAGFGPDTTPYSARHSTITKWCQSGMNLADIATIAGTSVEMIKNHYHKSIPEYVKKHLDSVAFDL